jgi:high affinity Mn2+ porin
MTIKIAVLTALLFACHPLMGQQTDAANSASAQSTPERLNLYCQATSIGQYHGVFKSPYHGPLSFQNYPERDVSLTTTFFLGFRLSNHAQLYFDPEIAGGKGLSAVNGIANASNGEMPSVQTATPRPYIARLYASYDFGFGSDRSANTPRST